MAVPDEFSVTWALFVELEMACEHRELPDPEVDALVAGAEQTIGAEGLASGWALVAAWLRGPPHRARRRLRLRLRGLAAPGPVRQRRRRERGNRVIPLVCEFCHQAVAIEDAAIFGPPVTSDEELTRLAERHMRGESELVALHPQCDALP